MRDEGDMENAGANLNRAYASQQRVQGSGYGVLGVQPTERSYFEEVGTFTFRIKKLTNGYTASGVGWNATYFEDIPAILRHVAFVLGGEDAVPMPVVSAEEAGLIDRDQNVLDLGTNEDTLRKAVSHAVERLKETILVAIETTERAPGYVTAEVDKVFKAFGYADYHDYATTKGISRDDYERILAAVENAVWERTGARVASGENKGD